MPKNLHSTVWPVGTAKKMVAKIPKYGKEAKTHNFMNWLQDFLVSMTHEKKNCWPIITILSDFVEFLVKFSKF